MPLKFTAICELFQNLENIVARDPPHLPAQKDKKLRQTVQQWFRLHRRILDNDSDYLAVLSTLFPERRTDRVYGIQSKNLERLVSRCLIFGEEKYRQLGRWKERDGGDLGECVERIERDFDCVPLPCGALTVEDVDAGLSELAARCRFSGPEIMKKVSAAIPDQIIRPLFYKMYSREKKWFIRLILKSMGRLQADWNRIEALLVSEFHFLLSPLLLFKNDLKATAALLRGDLKNYPAQPDFQSRQIFLKEAEATIVHPQVGIQVGRPKWAKARSFKHCLDMVGQGQWIIERKYDGEFVELHIDLSKGYQNRIKIFSKNGRDSTMDRKDLHQTLRQCLRIGRDDCAFKDKCILLGEMVVWSDLEQKVLGFEKLRKYVSRAGSFLGTEKDSQPHPYEHLMIVFFDVIIIDDDLAMIKPHEERRKLLSGLLTKIPGRASTAEWKLLDFATNQARKSLVIQFTAAIIQRCEGLVLKPNASYFSLGPAKPNSGFRGFIKLKKDYMPDMGGERDVADFAVVGASYEVKEAQKSGQQRLRWTNFFLGCLMDDEQAQYRSRPKFKIVAIIKQDHCIPPKDLQFLNQHGQFRETGYNPDGIDEFDIQLGRNPTPAVLFRDPFVVEVLGSAFDKPANEDFWMLRHPRVLKIHLDRSWQDCITVSGLAQLANEARNAPAAGDSQEMRRLVEKLYGKMKRADERERSQQTTPRSSITESPTTAVRQAIHLANEGTPTTVATFRAGAGQCIYTDAALTAPFQHHSPKPCPNPFTFGTINTMFHADSRRQTSATQLSTHFTQTILTPRSSQAVQKPRVEISPPKRGGPNVDLQLHAATDPTQRAIVPTTRQTAPIQVLAGPKSRHAQSVRAKDATCGQPARDSDTPAPRVKIPTKATKQLSSLRITKPCLIQHTEKPHIAVCGPQRVVPRDFRVKHANSEHTLVIESRARSTSRHQQAEMRIQSNPLITPKSTPDGPSSTFASLTPRSTPKLPFGLDVLPTPRPSSRRETAAPPFKTVTLAPARDSKSNATRISTKESLQALQMLPVLPDPSMMTRSKRTRAVDDFDIDMMPRKIPKWGRSSSLLYDDATSPRQSSSSSSSSSGIESKLVATSLEALPFALPSTAVLLPASLNASATFQKIRSALSSSGARVGALTTDISHWRRDPTKYEPMGPVVGESQAWDEAQGWKRIVFIEGVENAGSGKEAFVQKVRDEVGNSATGTAVFDWRVVCDLHRAGYGLGVGGEQEAKVWRKRFWGRV